MPYAARNAIFQELTEVIEFDSTYINYHHLSLLCDRMTCNDSMVSVFRHGINNDNIGPIAKASFEETPEMFIKAAKHAELDTMRGVSANVMCGQEGFFGTAAFDVVLDIDKVTQLAAEEWVASDDVNIIQNAFDGLNKTDEPCAINNIAIKSNILNIQSSNLGNQDTNYDPGF